MSAQRTYTISFRQVNVTAVQDLCAAYAGANMAIEVVSLILGETGSTTAELLEVSVKYVPTTVTPGTIGSAFTPTRDTPTDAAATFTARINDTTPATSTGTILFPHVDVWSLPNGSYQWIFPERARPSCRPSEALIFSLDRAPGGVRVMTGQMKVRELF
jgi:hypothetical protein